MDRVYSTPGDFSAPGPIPPIAGIGLRHQHVEEIIADRPKIGWLEAHAENYLDGGVVTDALSRARELYPLSVHATGLSLGSADGVDEALLAAIVDLCHRTDPGLVSDHLSWSTVGGVYLPDLLPLPYTEEAIAVVTRNVVRAQDALRRSILIENPSVYASFAHSTLSEGEFLAELVGRTGCGVLLDVNNVAVSAANLGEAPSDRLGCLLDSVPHAAIGEVHLAGHAVCRTADGGDVRIDDHGSPVSDEVWRLFAAVVDRIGPRPTLIEWDTNIPTLDVLRGEAGAAQAVIDHVAPATPRGRARLAAVG